MSVFSEVSTTDLVTQIARQITEAIVTGHLKPGERLTELQLSREFGTSRAPVREAARLLESQGLVTFSPRRGFFVRTFSASEMRDIYELRIGLELHAGCLAVERATEADLAALEKQLGRLYGTAGQASIETQIFEDFAFHRMICKASGNARLIRVYDELATEMRAGITLIGKIYDDPQRMAETHEPIMEALRKRDEEQLRGALRYHIAVAQDAVVALFEELEKGA